VLEIGRKGGKGKIEREEEEEEEEGKRPKSATRSRKDGLNPYP